MSGSDPETDVVVVGSGAGGAMAAYALTAAGAKVVLIEAGRDYDPVSETPMFHVPSQAPLRGAATPDKARGYFDATVGGGWDVPGEPYTVAPGSKFDWWRPRMLGGRTNHWGRLVPRFGPYDFLGFDRDGLGVNWPISYDDVAPWYDRVERLIGVFGDAENMENCPDSPPGVLQPPPQLRTYEMWMKMVMERDHGIPVVPAHMAILTRPLGDRPACVYATDCSRGCAIRANFQSTTVLLPPAMATGRLAIRTLAHAYEVTVDKRGRANGVRFFDAVTGAAHWQKARAVVLAASTCETARILLNSRSSAFPDGLANSSGEVGRNLLDSLSVDVTARVPQLEDIAAFNDEGVSLFHVNTPFWLYEQQRKGKLGFARGYQIELWGGRTQPRFDDMVTLAELTQGAGAEVHRSMRRLFGSVVYLTGRGEMLPNAGTYLDLDPDVRDRYGLPVARFHWQWGGNDLAQMTHARDTLHDVFASMGAELLTDPSQPIDQALRPGGHANHEVGTVRMGFDPRSSVLDAWNTAHDVPGLLVTDGAAFASNPHKNPTLTIMALAWRAADHLSRQLARGEL